MMCRCCDTEPAAPDSTFCPDCDTRLTARRPAMDSAARSLKAGCPWWIKLPFWVLVLPTFIVALRASLGLSTP